MILELTFRILETTHFIKEQVVFVQEAISAPLVLASLCHAILENTAQKKVKVANKLRMPLATEEN